MDNRTAILIGLVLIGLIGYDLYYNDAEYLLILGRKGVSLLEFLAFWR